MGVDGRGQVSEGRGDGGVDDGGGAVVGAGEEVGTDGRFVMGPRRPPGGGAQERGRI